MAPSKSDNQLVLAEFFPFQLTQLQQRLSAQLAKVYSKQVPLSRNEWRVLAALGEQTTITAKDIGKYSNLEKMQVSRAIQQMKKKGLLDSTKHPKDGRYEVLSLTVSGKDLYKSLVPLVKDYERQLLSALSPEEQRQLFTLLGKLTTHTQAWSVDDN